MCVTRVTSGMDRYRFDDMLEYTLSKQGRENVVLALIAAGSIAGILAIGRH
jgi:hypothetical protein